MSKTRQKRRESVSERKKNKSQRKSAKSLSQQVDVQEQDFYGEYLMFVQSAAKVRFNKFEYMKEYFNLGISEFPSLQQISDIQKSILQSSGWASTLKKNWTTDEKLVLIWAVGIISEMNDEDIREMSEESWNKISSIICRRDSEQCKMKWTSMQKVILQQQPFTPHEDEKLFEIIIEYQSQGQGQKWSQIANDLNQFTNIYRSSKQCRERWLNHLNPKISKSPWTDDEDIQLLIYVREHGRKWADISKNMDGKRSENHIKNRFTSLLRKEKDSSVIKSYDGVSTNLEDLLSAGNGPEVSELQKMAIDQLIEKINKRVSQMRELQRPQQQQQQQGRQEGRRRSTLWYLQKPQQQPTTHVRYQIGNMENDTNLQELTPCLVNVNKNIIYFCTHENMHNYLGMSQQPKDQFERIKSELSLFDLDFGFNTKFRSTLSMIEEIQNSHHSSQIRIENSEQLINTNELDRYFHYETPDIFSNIAYFTPLEIMSSKFINQTRTKWKSETMIKQVEIPKIIVNKTSPEIFLQS